MPRCQLRAPSAVSLGPARGPLPQTRHGLPRAPSSSFWKRLYTLEPDPPLRPPRSPKDPGDAAAKERGSLRVPPSLPAPGSSVHFHAPVTHSQILPHRLCPRVRTITPLHSQNTHETARAPVRVDAAPRAPPAPRAHSPRPETRGSFRGSGVGGTGRGDPGENENGGVPNTRPVSGSHCPCLLSLRLLFLLALVFVFAKCRNCLA